MKQLSPETFKDETSKGVILVDFFSTTCPPCKLLKKVLEPLSEEMKGRLSFFTFDVADDASICEKYEIDVVPTLILFKDGQEHSRQVGALPKPKLVAWIEAALK